MSYSYFISYELITEESAQYGSAAERGYTLGPSYFYPGASGKDEEYRISLLTSDIKEIQEDASDYLDREVSLSEAAARLAAFEILEHSGGLYIEVPDPHMITSRNWFTAVRGQDDLYGVQTEESEPAIGGSYSYHLEGFTDDQMKIITKILKKARHPRDAGSLEIQSTRSRRCSCRSQRSRTRKRKPCPVHSQRSRKYPYFMTLPESSELGKRLKFSQEHLGGSAILADDPGHKIKMTTLSDLLEDERKSLLKGLKFLGDPAAQGVLEDSIIVRYSAPDNRGKVWVLWSGERLSEHFFIRAGVLRKKIRDPSQEPRQRKVTGRINQVNIAGRSGKRASRPAYIPRAPIGGQQVYNHGTVQNRTNISGDASFEMGTDGKWKLRSRTELPTSMEEVKAVAEELGLRTRKMSKGSLRIYTLDMMESTKLRARLKALQVPFKDSFMKKHQGIQYDVLPADQWWRHRY